MFADSEHCVKPIIADSDRCRRLPADFTVTAWSRMILQLTARHERFASAWNVPGFCLWLLTSMFLGFAILLACDETIYIGPSYRAFVLYGSESTWTLRASGVFAVGLSAIVWPSPLTKALALVGQSMSIGIVAVLFYASNHGNSGWVAYGCLTIGTWWSLFVLCRSNRS